MEARPRDEWSSKAFPGPPSETRQLLVQMNVAAEELRKRGVEVPVLLAEMPEEEVPAEADDGAEQTPLQRANKMRVQVTKLLRKQQQLHSKRGRLLQEKAELEVKHTATGEQLAAVEGETRAVSVILCSWLCNWLCS